MSRDDLVDDSGAPNAFENDGYDEPGPESDEALTHALPAAGTMASDVDAVALVARSHASTSRGGDAPYNVHVATNHDGGVVAVVTTSGRTRVYERRGTDGGLETATARDVEVGCVVNECEFGPREDPYSLVCACGDGTVRVYDARCGDSRAVASLSRAGGRTRRVQRDSGWRSDGVDDRGRGRAARGVFRQTAPRRGRVARGHVSRRALRGGDARAISSRETTRALHAERRRTHVRVRLFARAPLNDEDALIAIMSADAAVNTIGFCRSGASGDERDAVWCATGVEEAHVFVASSDRRRVGVHLAHLKMRARWRARRRPIPLAPPPPLQNSSPASITSSACTTASPQANSF